MGAQLMSKAFYDRRSKRPMDIDTPVRGWALDTR